MQHACVTVTDTAVYQMGMGSNGKKKPDAMIGPSTKSRAIRSH